MVKPLLIGFRNLVFSGCIFGAMGWLFHFLGTLTSILAYFGYTPPIKAILQIETSSSMSDFSSEGLKDSFKIPAPPRIPNFGVCQEIWAFRRTDENKARLSCIQETNAKGKIGVTLTQFGSDIYSSSNAPGHQIYYALSTPESTRYPETKLDEWLITLYAVNYKNWKEQKFSFTARYCNKIRMEQEPIRIIGSNFDGENWAISIEIDCWQWSDSTGRTTTHLPEGSTHNEQMGAEFISTNDEYYVDTLDTTTINNLIKQEAPTRKLELRIPIKS